MVVRVGDAERRMDQGCLLCGERNMRLGVGVHTREVRDISEEPNKEKLHRQGIGAFGLVVCDQLWELTFGLADCQQFR